MEWKEGEMSARRIVAGLPTLLMDGAFARTIVATIVAAVAGSGGGNKGSAKKKKRRNHPR